MQREKCLRTLAWALVTAAAALASGGAARASTYNIIHQFQVPKYPTGNLVMDAAGNLYGTTVNGVRSTRCLFGCGVVWKLAPNGVLTMLYQFTGGADGDGPMAGVIRDAAGNLYGTTNGGGSLACGGGGGCGVVFKLAPNADGTWTESVLYSFTGTGGGTPSAGLIFDGAGNLYGTTPSGASPTCSACGVVFKLAPNADGTWTESVLHTFIGTGPSGLIFDGAGNLYGTTALGGSCGWCGVVFKLAPNADGSWTESVLHAFTGPDGASPRTGLIFDSAGNLYGTTGDGGTSTACYLGCGVVFKLAPNPDGTWTESVLHSFTGTDGLAPLAELTFDAAGNLYGTTYFGGGTRCAGEAPIEQGAVAPPPGCGVVFKLTPTSSGWSETVLRAFLGQARYPESPVIFDPKGNLYGTTFLGTGNNGVVFKITP